MARLTSYGPSYRQLHLAGRDFIEKGELHKRRLRRKGQDRARDLLIDKFFEI